ncbi:hypothetical protein CHH75_22785 [Paenibacillus sp. 7541]|uniref:Uncharacterized protein n=1 Tax=Paenibacillus campinasensis TaxID=66347 RepID=A0A268EYH5_9BACL|nr:hypothetical protein CHH67_07480 [Paenibacillus campinasensis]PAK48479.1 hypothetical protein CHH75_22785 [Paenibacillus sp. 7541]
MYAHSLMLCKFLLRENRYECKFIVFNVSYYDKLDIDKGIRFQIKNIRDIPLFSFVFEYI